MNKHFSAASALAAAAAIGGVVHSAGAAIVYSGPININIPSTTAGVYVNVVTGLNDPVPGNVPNWDIDPWSSSALNMFSPTGGIGGFVGTATTYFNLAPGTLISGASVFSGTGTATPDASTPLNLNSSNNLIGFKFQNEANGNALHYGWLRVSLSASSFSQPRAIVEYAYEDVAGQGILAGATSSDPNAGACCKADGTCSFVNATDCGTAGGTFTSIGTSCASAGCPTRCCMSDGTCQMLSSTACTTAGGVSTANATCAAACPQPGACCMGNGTCSQLMQAACASAGGVFGGSGVTCASFCGVSSISENFDAVAAGNLPSGWTNTSIVLGAGATAWTAATTSANSGPNSAFANDVAATSAQALNMPVLLATGPVTIDFWTRQITESGFDGLIVQASVNGGAYANIGQDAWRLNGYNANVTSTSNTFTAQRYVSGTLPDWTHRTASIPANNGDYVALRIVMSSDGSVGAVGAWVDDVTVTSASTGACCLANGTCQVSTVTACTGAGGVFNSAASCATAICAQAATLEVEANETRPTSTVVTFTTPGDYIQGNTTGAVTTAGATSLDQFLVKTPAMAPGIYRHRLTLRTPTGLTDAHTATIRGFNQTAVAAGVWSPGANGTAGVTDSTVQSSSSTYSVPPRMNQWYGFGKQEQLYYRVTGTTATTADYKSMWTVDPVTPVNLGSFQSGTLTITTVGQGHTTDTDLWVYDSAFNALDGFGNDGATTFGGAAASSTQSFLRRAFADGTYYLAVATTNVANNKGSPSDDNLRTGLLLDFPDVLTSSTANTALNVSFAVTDSAGTVPVSATRPVGAFEVLWYKFTVGTPCYANCDASTQVPVLNVADFTCFLQKYAANDPYANCDASTQPPVLNVADFTCFLQKYAAGCT